jgi:hypothetical protein
MEGQGGEGRGGRGGEGRGGEGRGGEGPHSIFLPEGPIGCLAATGAYTDHTTLQSANILQRYYDESDARIVFADEAVSMQTKFSMRMMR